MTQGHIDNGYRYDDPNRIPDDGGFCALRLAILEHEEVGYVKVTGEPSLIASQRSQTPWHFGY